MKVLFTAPTAFRAIKRADPEGDFIGRYDLRTFRTLFLAGERADPDTIQWAEQQLGVPVIDHWWQTETGWPICANPVGLAKQPVKHGSATKPMPGYEVSIVDADGQAGAEAGDRQHRDQAAAATGLFADALEQRRGLRVGVPDRVPGLLQDRRRGIRR